MAAHTPLPPNLRRGLAAFSGSLFINNKTRDSGAARSYPPGTGRGTLGRPGVGGVCVCVFAVVSSLRAHAAHHQPARAPPSREHPRGPCTHPPMRGSKTERICCKQPFLLPSHPPPWAARQRVPAGSPAYPCLPLPSPRGAGQPAPPDDALLQCLLLPGLVPGRGDDAAAEGTIPWGTWWWWGGHPAAARSPPAAGVHGQRRGEPLLN